MKIVRKKKLKTNSVDTKYINNELKVMALSSHPHLVKAFELLEDVKSYCIAMEYIQGGDLRKKLKQVKKFSEGEAVKIVK